MSHEEIKLNRLKKKQPAVRGYIEFREQGKKEDLKGEKAKVKPYSKKKMNWMITKEQYDLLCNHREILKFVHDNAYLSEGHHMDIIRLNDIYTQIKGHGKQMNCGNCIYDLCTELYTMLVQYETENA